MGSTTCSWRKLWAGVSRAPCFRGPGGGQESPPRKRQGPQAEAWPPASTTHRLRASSVTDMQTSTHFRVDICPGRRAAGRHCPSLPGGHAHLLSLARGTLLWDATQDPPTQDPPSVPPSSRRGAHSSHPTVVEARGTGGVAPLLVCPEPKGSWGRRACSSKTWEVLGEVGHAGHPSDRSDPRGRTGIYDGAGVGKLVSPRSSGGDAAPSPQASPVAFTGPRSAHGDIHEVRGGTVGDKWGWDGGGRLLSAPTAEPHPGSVC